MFSNTSSQTESHKNNIEILREKIKLLHSSKRLPVKQIKKNQIRAYFSDSDMLHSGALFRGQGEQKRLSFK